MKNDKEPVLKLKQLPSDRVPKSVRTVKVPLSWRIWAWAGYVLMAIGIFSAFYFSQAADTHENPFHPFDAQETIAFGFLFGGLGAALIKFLIVDKIVLRLAQKRSTAQIAKEIAGDVVREGTEMLAVGILDVATGASGGASKGNQPRDRTSGGGGKFSGGGSSGDY